MKTQSALAVAALAAALAATARGEFEFDLGADLRIRQELMKNVPGLPGGGWLSTAKSGPFRNQVRFRPDVWFELKASSETMGEWRIFTKLTDEFRWNPEPKVDTTTFPCELILDNLFIEGKGVFDGFLDLRIGRQNLYNYCGLDHIFIDGTPGDGSRTCYADMAAFTFHFTEDSKLDLFALYNTDDCDVRWGTDRSRHTHLTGLGRGGDRDEWGYGAIWSSKLSDNLPYQIFAMEKGSTTFWVDDVRYPWTRRALLGARIDPRLDEEWSLQLEAMGQCGRDGDGHTLCGGFGYAAVKWKSAREGIRPFGSLGLMFMSGDDEVKSAPAGCTAWDPMWYRGANDSEIFLYGTHYAVGWWSNMYHLKLAAGLDISRGHNFLAYTGPVFAAAQDGLGGGDGMFKGLLSVLRYEFPILLADRDKGERLEIFGHLYAEFFNPGDYYETSRPAWFLRWQIMFKF